MQIIGDKHGNCVWVGERDCSAQRRHQKLIEESPAPAFPAEIRQAMGEAAVKVAKACGYYNAGTVEFLYQDGEFFFLEMNTRLQVEHPVTELVTGIDLVAEQIRVASGEPLSFTQDDVELRGHAIEVRINAEDPAEGRFLPSPGRITKLVPPAGLRRPLGRRLRVRRRGQPVLRQPRRQAHRAGARTGDTAIAPHAPGARARSRIEGIATTIPADLAILEHPDFADAEHSTKWVEDDARPHRRQRRAGAPAGRRRRAEPKVQRDVDVEVNGKRFAVKVWVPESRRGRRRRRWRRGRAPPRARPPRRRRGRGRQRHGHRADAGHDREGARRGGRGGRGRASRCACSRR